MRRYALYRVPILVTYCLYFKSQSIAVCSLCSRIHDTMWADGRKMTSTGEQMSTKGGNPSAPLEIQTNLEQADDKVWERLAYYADSRREGHMAPPPPLPLLPPVEVLPLAPPGPEMETQGHTHLFIPPDKERELAGCGFNSLLVSSCHQDFSCVWYSVCSTLRCIEFKVSIIKLIYSNYILLLASQLWGFPTFLYLVWE